MMESTRFGEKLEILQNFDAAMLPQANADRTRVAGPPPAVSRPTFRYQGCFASKSTRNAGVTPFSINARNFVT